MMLSTTSPADEDARDEWYDDERTGEVVTLGHLATPARRVRADATLQDARALLIESRAPALVVVDATDTLVGVLARTDVLRFAHRLDATAREAMSPFVFALPHIATVERAAALMAYECVSFVIVIGDDRELCGTISALDVARHYAMEAGYIS
jgi:CBS domain-containing protein